MTTAPSFHPDLRRVARFLPRSPVAPWMVPVLRVLSRLPRPVRLPEDVTVRNAHAPGPPGAPEVRVRLYTPPVRGRVPALLWIHGGGYVVGDPEQDDRFCAEYAHALGIVVASVDYRLAPEHPFPAPLDDCDAALSWLATQPDVEASRIAIGGASAGGGLAAALAQRAHDRREVTPVFQLLVYPMLDDRTTARTDVDDTHHRLWSQRSNAFGWNAYLGHPPGRPEVAPHAVPARRDDLRGLPPAWIGVGTFDLFHDEDLAYARRLDLAGVPCEVHVVAGAYHGFDAISWHAPVVRRFWGTHVAAVRRALFPDA